MRPLKLSWIIHIFAILHALVALGCRLSGVDDQLLLTVLTMALSLIICMRMGLKIEFTAAIIIIVNILGFLLGTLGANLLQSFIHSEYAIHCISTAITTEILGWSMIALTKVFGLKEVSAEELRSSPYMKWFLLIASGIFILRLIIVIFGSRYNIAQDAVFGIIQKAMTNIFSLIILTCVNILFIRSMAAREKPSSRSSTIIIYITFMILATLLEVFLIGSEGESPVLLFIVSLFVQITLYCVIYMINYAIITRDEMHEQREKANMAQYRYIKLKHQVNPHFLFNSLNILDCLVCEEKTEQASTYIHKLAGLYRYMLKTEEEKLVSLEEELEFAGRYYDLLKVRFPQGLELEVSVPEGYRSRYVIPCALQLLIENATKHNAINASNPLTIIIKAENDSVTVCNRIISKISTSPSTGLGLKYMRQQYLDISGKTVEIEHTEEIFSVTIPLL